MKTSAEFQPGSVLADKYRIDRVLGEGGMGMVLAAHHLQLDERVAIKVLLPEMLVNSEAVARFAREARAAAKIKSEHVARVSDVGTLPDGSPYLVMEYLEGEDLAKWIESRGALSIEQAVEFVLQACEALAEAHSLGIIHRDLKPANLYAIRRADGLLSIKVLDFGISKMISTSASRPEIAMTRTNAVMGSPLYMSPEQMQSARAVDARSDIWAIGAILYELVAARTPFSGESFPELVLNIAGSAPRPLRDARPDVPLGLEQVILRCLEKDRGKRFPNVGELALALLEFGPKRARSSVERISRVVQAGGLSASALALPPSSDQDADALKPSGTLATWGRTGTGEPKSRATLYIALGVAVGAAAAAAAGIAFRPRAPGPEAPAHAASVTQATAIPDPAPLPAPPPSPVAPVVAAATARPVAVPPPSAESAILPTRKPVRPTVSTATVKSAASVVTAAPPPPPPPSSTAKVLPKKGNELGGRL